MYKSELINILAYNIHNYYQWSGLSLQSFCGEVDVKRVSDLFDRMYLLNDDEIDYFAKIYNPTYDIRTNYSKFKDVNDTQHLVFNIYKLLENAPAKTAVRIMDLKEFSNGKITDTGKFISDQLTETYINEEDRTVRLCPWHRFVTQEDNLTQKELSELEDFYTRKEMLGKVFSCVGVIDTNNADIRFFSGTGRAARFYGITAEKVSMAIRTGKRIDGRIYDAYDEIPVGYHYTRVNYDR